MSTQWYQDAISNPYNPSAGEYGVDFATPFNTPITALYGGQVIEAQRTDWGNGTSSGGIVTVLANIPGLGQRLTYYLHLDTLNPGIAAGSYVTPGELLGLSGGQTSGGNWPTSPQYSSGPHTEFGVDAPFAGTDTNVNLNAAPLFLSQFGVNPADIGSGSTSNAPASPSNPSNIINTGLSIPGIISGISGGIIDIMQRGVLVIAGLGLLLVGLIVVFFSAKKTEVNIQESKG